jgi:hypothetical protein
MRYKQTGDAGDTVLRETGEKQMSGCSYAGVNITAALPLAQEQRKDKSCCTSYDAAGSARSNAPNAGLAARMLVIRRRTSI